jgi:GAF domain-containing protein
MSVLEIVQIHHEALAKAVDNESGTNAAATVDAAAEFLIESLAAFEMMQRGFTEARRAAFVERRNARILRQLSTLLTDESLASGDFEALEEVLQLVAENAREITGALRGLVHMAPANAGASIEVRSEGDGQDTWSEVLQPNIGSTVDPSRREEAVLEVPLLSLDGAMFGYVEVAGKQSGAFTRDDEAALTQVAQMTAAAVERALAYH